MGSFPTFIREAQHSPRSLDSAFPPFNPVHKYKGVYERAGFDVNKKGYKQNHDDDRGSNRSISSSSRWGPRNQSNDSFGNKSNGSGSYKTATKESLPLVGQVPAPNNHGSKPAFESSSGSSKSNSMNSYEQNNNSASTSHRTSPEYPQYQGDAQYNAQYNEQQYERKNSHASNNSQHSMGNTNNTVHYDGVTAAPTSISTSPHKPHKNVKNLTLDLNNDAEEQEFGDQQQQQEQQQQQQQEQQHSQFATSHHPNSSMNSVHSNHSVPSHQSNHSVASHHSSHSYHSNRSNGSNHLTHQEVIEEIPEAKEKENAVMQTHSVPATTSKEDKYAQQGYQLPTPQSARGPAPPQMYPQKAPAQPFDPRKTRKRPPMTPMAMNGAPGGVPMNPSYPPHANRNVSPIANGGAAIPYPISPNYSPKLQQQPFTNHMNGMAPMPGAGKITSQNNYHHHPHPVPPPMQKGPSPTAMYHHGVSNSGLPRSMTGIPNPVGQPPMPSSSMPRSMTGIPPAPPNWQMNQPRPQSPGYPPRSQKRPVPPPMISPNQHQQPHFRPQGPMPPQQRGQTQTMAPPNQQRYQTGIPRQPTYSQVREDKLSPALDEFKHDLENHQSSSPNNNFTKPERDSIELENSLDARLMQDPDERAHESSQGQRAEYQQFLSTKPMNKSEDYKRGSTVSSILSKDSIDEEEKRIEQELEAQLQNLKNGGEHEGQEEDEEDINLSHNVSSPQKSVSGESTASTTRPPIPQFTVQDVDEVKQTRVSSGSNNTKDSNCDEMSIASIESIQPLSVSHSHISPTKRDMSQMEGNSPHPYGVPERKDSAEFTRIIAELDQFEEEMPRSTPDISASSDEPNFGTFNDTNNTTVSPTKPATNCHEPGAGPCRSCNQPIDSSARGSLKAIFSKTGELSGQWHRGCFKCSYKACATHFNKQVQCYVLDDEPYCFQHYHLLNATTCKSCGVGIEGSCIENDLGQKWHMHCLKCTSCHGQIEQDYYVVNDQIMCETDAKKYLHNGGSGSHEDKVEKRRTRMYYA
ncbi:hypothetical protein KGF57_000951 [Candida theae]|uniref:LIM zinc-binding domain-containing protein n=1 Tax=Candida theae TaxID=1198502 RepID=A0AAD5BIB2_9ASCO|nr:uncharacterized protein KGF57_000951 [Candida theae]KAI5964459.1 hypothetical protein KGF57_000951 [Candida theae]